MIDIHKKAIPFIVALVCIENFKTSVQARPGCAAICTDCLLLWMLGPPKTTKKYQKLYSLQRSAWNIFSWTEIDQARVPPDWSCQSASWLAEPECSMIGQTVLPPDWSSQSASWLVKPERLLIGQARVPHDWSNFTASWLVEPECLLIGWARVPPY